MWRFWTPGWGPRGWWHWFREEGFPVWVAWHLPPRIVLWAFIRVFSYKGANTSSTYSQAYDQWVTTYHL